MVTDSVGCFAFDSIHLTKPETLQFDIDRILLDNMNCDELRKCVEITNGKIDLAASGNVNLETVKEIADYCIEIPSCFEELMPLLSIIPLQLLSYHIAVMRKCNVDQPRNLAKSVTVE